MTASLADGSSVAAPLAVAADGRDVAGARGGRHRDLDAEPIRSPRSCSISAHSREHGFISTEFHTETGPFTQVPLPGNRSSLVWVVKPETAEELAALDDAALSRRVEEQMQSMLGRVTRRARPADLSAFGD